MSRCVFLVLCLLPEACSADRDYPKFLTSNCRRDVPFGCAFRPEDYDPSVSSSKSCSEDVLMGVTRCVTLGAWCGPGCHRSWWRNMKRLVL